MTRKPEEPRQRVHLGCKWQGETGLSKGVHWEGAAPAGKPEILPAPPGIHHRRKENLRTAASQPGTGLRGSRLGALSLCDPSPQRSQCRAPASTIPGTGLRAPTCPGWYKTFTLLTSDDRCGRQGEMLPGP